LTETFCVLASERSGLRDAKVWICTQGFKGLEMLLRCMQRHFRSKVPPKVPPLFGRDAFLEREQWGIPAADSKSGRQKLLCNICTSTSWVMSLCVTYWMLLHRIALAWDSKAEAWSSGRDAAKAKALSSGRDALLDREQNGI
jgi:hypothetical protein